MHISFQTITLSFIICFICVLLLFCPNYVSFSSILFRIRQNKINLSCILWVLVMFYWRYKLTKKFFFNLLDRLNNYSNYTSKEDANRSKTASNQISPVFVMILKLHCSYHLHHSASLLLFIFTNKFDKLKISHQCRWKRNSHKGL